MIKLVALLFLFLPAMLPSQPLTKTEAGNFFRDLLSSPDSLNRWFDPADDSVSHRLGIQYDGARFKNLIASDPGDSVRLQLRTGRLTYTIQTESLEDSFVKVVVAGPLFREATYFFRGKYLVSSLAYFSRKWAIRESEHFRFFISDTTLFNPSCIEELESFLREASSLLGLTSGDLGLTAREKFYYYLCKNEDEIEEMTGFRVRGMGSLAYDAVVSTYNYHVHELLHLLINYKLRSLPLYTHPLLQEGFAVAYGGRGGLHPAALLPTGAFLCASDFVDVHTLLNKQEFDRQDASMTYPVAGLYNRFLVETLGIPAYLRLYRKHCGGPADSSVLVINTSEIPPDSAWESFLKNYSQRPDVMPDSVIHQSDILLNDSLFVISQDDSTYQFFLSGTSLVPGDRIFPAYRSVIAGERAPNFVYHSEKYLISVSKGEISVYNCWTNTLIAGYVASFSMPPTSVPQKDGRFGFTIRKSLFRQIPDWTKAIRVKNY